MARGSWWSAGALLSAVAVFVVSWMLTRGEAGIGDAARGSAGSDGPGIEAADASRGPRFATAPESEAAASDGGGSLQGAAFELHGRLIDETGAAVEGAEVRAGSARGVSAQRGEFALDLPARDLADESLRVFASAAGPRIGTTRARIGEREPLVVLLTRPRTVTVFVRKAGGGPAEGVAVDVVASGDVEDGTALRSGVTSADGSVVVKDLPAISLELRTHSAATVPTRQLLGSGCADQEAHLVVEPGPALTLVALDEERRPVAGARAVVTDRTLGRALALASDGHGRFPTLGVSKGPQRIVVTHPGRATAFEQVETSESLEREIVLRERGALEVAIETPKWQREGDGTWLVEARPVEGDARPRLRGVAGARRVAVLDGAERGSTWSLDASFFGRSGSLVVGSLRVADAVRVDGKGAVVHWKPPELFRVSAACRDAKGVPIRDASVRFSATHAGSSERCDVAADEFGSAVGWVAGGTYRIEARSPTASAALRRSEIVVDEDCDVDVEFARGRTIRGTVASPDGNPLGREVVAEGGGTTRRAWSDGAGRFELRGIAPGPCKVRALGRHGEADAGSVAVAAGDGDVDDCRVVVAPGAIVGRVTGQRGERARVTACAGDVREDFEQGRVPAIVVTWTDPEGKFRIDDVGAGPWSVLAETESEYGKGIGRTQQVGGVGGWSGVVRGDTNLQIDVAWK
jgi:hypothetical protein